jgi:aldehyde dehydrogenase (NAD+)
MEAIKDALSFNEIQTLFKNQKENQFKVANKPIAERKKKLKQLKTAIEVTFRDEIRTALYNDFKKHPSESDLTEIYPITGEIKHALNNLKKWTKRKRITTPLAFFGASSHIQYEPKGVCLIISPWNFPFNLTFGPLVSAIAAGNTVILKPSEHTVNSSHLIKKIVKSIFSEDEVVVIEGAVETSKHLLSLPFNHIFFTGSPNVGKIVMAAAAKNLTSVTLELGGKSPTIIDETANIDNAAKRIVWGKFINAGQICIAPDYIFVHENIKEELIKAFQKYLKVFFGDNITKSDAFPRIVNKSHTKRILNLIEDSKNKGSEIVFGGISSVEDKYIQPTLITNVSLDSEIMEQEIFGPVLPIISFKNVEEVINHVNSKEKPLALYIYSNKKANINYLIKNTRAGGTCVNSNDIHFFNNNLPFGGSNNSGIGKSHGFFGFQAFSNARSIYNQHIPGALELLMPPYTNFKQKLIDLTIKWF